MKLSNSILFILIIINLNACKSTYSTKSKYSSKSFLKQDIPQIPNFSELQSWAAHPELKNSPLNKYKSDNPKVDVFYIYPTIITETSNTDWNADIYDDKLRKNIIDIAIKYQASAWADHSRVYSPFYRQVHYRAFFEPFIENGGRSAYEIAYKDVKDAFEYYLKNYNNGRPIVIAGHSQGSGHGARILKEYFDGKELQKQLVAAYLIGTNLKEKEFNNINPMYNASETGGFVNWNSYKKNKKPRLNKDPAYKSWKNNNVVVNPITWNKQKYSKIENHKGILYYNEKIYPKTIKVELTKGMLWVSPPKKLPNRIFLRFIRNLHFGDINLFWEDIRQNSILRINSYLSITK